MYVSGCVRVCVLFWMNPDSVEMGFRVFVCWKFLLRVSWPRFMKRISPEIGYSFVFDVNVIYVFVCVYVHGDCLIDFFSE